MDFALHNPWIVAVLPAGAAALIALATRQAKNLSAGLAIAATAIALFLSLGLLETAVQGGQPALMASFGNYRWASFGDVTLTVDWGLTPLSCVMLVVVTLVSALVQIYSLRYMHDEPPSAFARYYGALALFTFAMVALVIADNLLLMFAGWELVGVSSYLLIGHWFSKPEAAQAAKKAFVINRIGDLGLLLGILLLYSYTGELSFGGNSQAIAKGLVPATALGITMVLLFWGPIGKSAQVPLHVWLPDAMEGPTPVSALIHAATMVAAGVYFVARLFELFVVSPPWVLATVAAVGAVTALLAAAIALVQNDIKKVLAYSTVSQLGFMMVALGMGPIGYTAGVFHLVTHAGFKALLFLGAGSVIHATGSQDLRDLGGLRKAMPITATTFLIGTLSIAGLPFVTAGFWSKEAIFHATLTQNPALFGVVAAAAVMTAFYMFRLYFRTFEGEYQGKAQPQESSPLMTVPLVILAIPAVALGWLDAPFLNHAFSRFIHYGNTQALHAASGMNWGLVAASTGIFALGAGLAYAMYMAKSVDAISLAKRYGQAHEVLNEKFYIDELYQTIVDRLVMGWAWLCNKVERLVVDGLVNGVALGAVAGGEGLKLLQSGRVQTYGLIGVGSLLAIILILTRL